MRDHQLKNCHTMVVVKIPSYSWNLNLFKLKKASLIIESENCVIDQMKEQASKHWLFDVSKFECENILRRNVILYKQVSVPWEWEITGMKLPSH